MCKQIKLIKTAAEDLAKHKSEDFMELYFDFIKLFDEYFESQALEYIKNLEDYPKIKISKLSFIEKLQLKLKNFVLLGQKEANEDILGDLLSIGEEHNGIDITDDFALEYAEKHSAELVTNIDNTTEETINLIIQNGIKNGETITEIASNIKDKFADFTLYRSSLIAQMETGTAYYYGNEVQYDLYEKDLNTEGWHRSFTQGDSNVRESHQKNADDGWIKRSQNFSGTNDSTPPYDFNCRCYKKISIINPESGKLD